MAETLTELVAKIKTDATELEKGLTDAEKQTEASSKKMQDSLKKVGMAMAASGAAITAALGLMGKAAIDEEINVKHLQVALKGVGVSYDSVKDSLEAVIAATQRKTGIADNEQRNVLSQLILVTKDYTKAQKLLPMALDLAAYSSMNATSAATYLGKAYEELEAGADRIGIRMGTTTVYFKDLDEVQRMVGGTAEAMVNPFSVLSATMGDVTEAIGSFLIPTIKDLVNKFAAVSDGIQNWIKLNPELIGGLVLATAKLGLLLLTIGSIILILPKIVGFVTMLTGLMGPWGWAVLAVAGFIGYLVAELLGLNKVMAGIKDIMADVEKQMFIMRAEQALSAEEWAKIKEQGYLTEQQFINLAKAMKLTTEELYNQMEASGMLQIAMTSMGDTNIYLAETINKTADSADNAAKTFDPELSNALNKVGSETNDLTDRFADLMRRLRFAETEAGELHLTMDDVYIAMYKLGYKTEQISDVFKRYGNITEIDELLLGELGLTANDVARITGKLKDEIDKGTESFKKYGEEAKKANDEVSKAFLNLTQAKTGATTGGITGIPISEADFDAIYNARQAAVAEVMSKEGISKEAALALVEPETYGSVARYVEAVAKEASQYLSEELHTAYGVGEQGVVQTVVSPYAGEYATGGVVPGAIGQPQLAMVHGGETIIPANESMGNVVINFTQPVFFDREDTMNKFVNMIRKGIQRQDRIRFGNAYSG